MAEIKPYRMTPQAIVDHLVFHGWTEGDAESAVLESFPEGILVAFDTVDVKTVRVRIVFPELPTENED